mmetsp:Transcript_43533/g.136702  ORF Transcript_43533/g.136702 Transcript_43533/m.136702 type:complete len:229 (-) Transcript_43533:346-1032(-)
MARRKSLLRQLKDPRATVNMTARCHATMLAKPGWTCKDGPYASIDGWAVLMAIGCATPRAANCCIRASLRRTKVSMSCSRALFCPSVWLSLSSCSWSWDSFSGWTGGPLSPISARILSMADLWSAMTSALWLCARIVWWSSRFTDLISWSQRCPTSASILFRASNCPKELPRSPMPSRTSTRLTLAWSVWKPASSRRISAPTCDSEARVAAFNMGATVRLTAASISCS